MALALLPSLFKAALLLSHALCTYYGMTPPTPPPRRTEEKPNRIVIPDFLNRAPTLQKTLTLCAKILLCCATTAEAVALLLQAFSPTALNWHGSVFSALSDVHSNSTSIAIIASPLATAGGLTRVPWCHHTLGRFFIWEMTVRADHRLVTSGPYSVVRHPSYAGWLMLVTGNLLFLFGAYDGTAPETFVQMLLRSILGRTLTAVLVTHLMWVTGALLWRTQTEDRMMRTEFGKEWKEWAQMTRYRLIPGLY